jgi:hypothetical protein
MVFQCDLAANGPAIKLVNVTRRPEAGEHCTLLWRKCIEAGEGGYGACFCSPGREFNWVLRVSRYKMWCAPYVVPGYSVILGHWCSVAVQSWCAPVVVHGYWGFYGQRRESGFITTPVVVQRAENQCKNRDEFINFIVRVMGQACALSYSRVQRV